MALLVQFVGRNQLIEDTIEAAQKKRKVKTLGGILIYSEQGSVYRSLMYNNLSKQLKFLPNADQ